MGKTVRIADIDDAAICPEALAYLWDHFSEVSMGLASNGFGPALVTWEALRAWSEFMSVRLEPWEAKVLVTLGYKRAVIDDEEREKKARRGGQNKN